MANGSEVFEVLMTNAVKLPGVKVDRKEFLAQSFSKYVPASQLVEIVEKGPLEANVPLSVIKKVAKRNITNQTMKSSSASWIVNTKLDSFYEVSLFVLFRRQVS